jgi:hypothetical protein
MSKENENLNDAQESALNIDNAVNDLLAAGNFSGRYKGKDNSGKPKTEYLKKMVLTANAIRRQGLRCTPFQPCTNDK